MKTLKLIGLLCMLVLLTTNCRKDEIITSENTNPTTITESVKFQFIINKSNYSPILNAQLFINGDTYETNLDGIVLTKAYDVPIAGLKVEITAPGYDSLIKMVNGPKSATKIERVVLERSIVNMISTGSAGPIAKDGSLLLPSSLTQSNGSSYSGQVSVKSIYLNPDDDDFLLAAPGNLLAVNNENEYQQLASIGMYKIELNDMDGNVLSIPEGSIATITFPLADRHKDIFISEVPLWYFDEEVGVWKEDGIGIIKDNTIIAEVSHFTWWNCDLPYDFTEICFVFKDIEETIISGMEVQFYINDVAFGSAVTNNDGVIVGKMPIEEEIEVKFRLYGTDLGSKFIGTFSEGSLKLNVFVGAVINSISGKANDCIGDPISNGYGYFKVENKTFTVSLDNGGNFNYSAPQVEHTLTLVDIEEEKFMQVLIPENDQSENLILDDISVCEHQNMTKVSGYVIVDTDGDNIGDSPPSFGWVMLANIENFDVKQVFLDSEGYYECIILPGMVYSVGFSTIEYVGIAGGDLSPEGNVENEIYKVGTFNLRTLVDQDEHDRDNNFLAIPAGKGIVSGSFLGDTDGDGVGDIPLEWLSLGFGNDLNFKTAGYVISDGTFAIEMSAGYNELRTNSNFVHLIDWDTTPDPDGDDSDLGSNEIIPVIMHDGEADSDNEFVVDYSNRSDLICQVLEDTNFDGEGDVPIEGVEVVLKNRQSGISIGSSKTNEFGIIKRGWVGFEEVLLTVSLKGAEYEVIDVKDTSPDNDPFIIDGDKTKMEIDLVIKEWDAGNIFIVRKI